LSVDNLIPNLPVASRRAAGDIDAKCSIERALPNFGVRL
jgi:hypothetical protein